jgi:hypothetical protein
MNHMTTLRRAMLGALLAVSVGAASAQEAAAPATPKSRGQAADSWTADGLQKVEVKGIDVAFARPGASLAGYDKVLLLPPSVAFRRDWGRSSRSVTGRVQPDDAQRIKDRLAELITQELTAEFTAGGYVMAAQPADDVLEVEVRIIDLNIVAPDVPTMGRKEVYAVSPGEMTLIADLRDSASGESIMRVYDHEDGDASSRMRRITRMDNKAEATRLARDWAKTLRLQLDAARAAASQ